VLGQIRERQSVVRLADYLGDPADEVRLQAALALEALAAAGMLDDPDQSLLDLLRRLTNDPVERVRQAAIALIGRSGPPDMHPLLVAALSDPGAPVRETAAEALVQMGKAAIPLVHPQLDADSSQQRKMAAFMLSRINRHQFGSLLDAYITTGNLIAIYENHGLLHALAPLGHYAGGVLLLDLIRERNRHLLDEIFFLLGGLHDAESIRVIVDSLRSDNSRTRANAAEALEALTTPQTASLIAPLLDSTTTSTQLLDTSQHVWNMSMLDTTAAFREVQSGSDRWLRAIATYTLGEAVLVTLAEQQAVNAASAAPAASTEPPAEQDALDTMLSGLKARRRAPRSEKSPPAPRATQPAPPASPLSLSLSDMELLLLNALDDPDRDVCRAARTATQHIAGLSPFDTVDEEGIVLSTIERIIFLKEVPFFEGMTVEQLKILATVCEEQRFAPDTRIISQGDSGGTLYVIINGKVGIEQEKRSRYSARVATLGARSYFGEISLFHEIPHTAHAIALDETFTLKLRREPLIALARQYPELSLELIRVLSQRLNEANVRIADLTRARPREIHKLFDHFDEEDKA
jgi:CRP-like cAMP-binding protein